MTVRSPDYLAVMHCNQPMRSAPTPLTALGLHSRPNFYQIFPACYLWAWLPSPLVAFWYGFVDDVIFAHNGQEWAMRIKGRIHKVIHWRHIVAGGGGGGEVWKERNRMMMSVKRIRHRRLFTRCIVTIAWSVCLRKNKVRQKIHREAEKRNQFSFVCVSFNTWQKLVKIFTYIKKRISYNSIYLILACINNFE